VKFLLDSGDMKFQLFYLLTAITGIYRPMNIFYSF